MGATTLFEAESPSSAFWTSIQLLQHALTDADTSLMELICRFAEALDRLDFVPVEKPIFAAAKYTLLANLRRIVWHHQLGSTEAMGDRRGAAVDIEFHGKKVVAHAWL